MRGAAAIAQASEPQFVAEARWYAIYTCARHEKRVSEQLERKDIEHFLPLYEAVHRWKDRRMRVQLPLFPGYLFVRIPLAEKLKVLELPSVVRMVAFQGVPAALPDEEMAALRNGLDGNLRAEPHPYLKVGRRVRVVRGPLAGMEGMLVRKKERLRLVISIDLIMRSMAVEIDAADVEPLR
jgi:transcription antitermination factor NusG